MICKFIKIDAPFSFICKELLRVGWWFGGGWGGYDQLCCPANHRLLLGLDLGLDCDNYASHSKYSLFLIILLNPLLLLMHALFNMIAQLINVMNYLPVC